MKSPMVLGLDLRDIPQHVLTILMNKEVIQVNQDELAIQARRISSVPAPHRSTNTTKAMLLPCNGSDPRQRWQVDTSSGEVRQAGSASEHMCLEVFECETPSAIGTPRELFLGPNEYSLL